nr:Yip1 family protein [uncultured Methanoregula sp.]
MIDTLVTKVKGFLLNPVETFQQSRADEPRAVFTYFGVLLLFNAILSAVVTAVGIETLKMFNGMSFGLAIPVLVFVMILIGGFICTLILGAWLHLWVYILGGRKGIMQTINAVIYGSTPRLLLGWIPFIGFLFALWSLVLGVIGIRELQEMSTERAVIAVVIAVLIPLIVIILVAAYFITSVMSVTSIPVAPLNS